MYLPGPGTINGLAILPEPLAHTPQHVLLLGIDGSVGLGTERQQQTSTTTDTVNEPVDDLPW
jgi:hypothetical protein